MVLVAPNLIGSPHINQFQTKRQLISALNDTSTQNSLDGQF